MCYYNNLCLPDGRARRQARKKFLAARLALAPPPLAGDKRRVNAGRARRGGLGRGRFRGTLGEARGRSGRGGAGLAAGGFAGRSGRRAAGAGAAGRGRSLGPTRSWLRRPRRCGRGFADPGAAHFRPCGGALDLPAPPPALRLPPRAAKSTLRRQRMRDDAPVRRANAPRLSGAATRWGGGGAATTGVAEAARSRLAPVAQSVEQLTFNQWVPGSIPGGRTNQTRGWPKGQALGSSPVAHPTPRRCASGARGSAPAMCARATSAGHQGRRSRASVEGIGRGPEKKSRGRFGRRGRAAVSHP